MSTRCVLEGRERSFADRDVLLSVAAADADAADDAALILDRKRCVARLWPAAVYAFAIAISTPVIRASSMRCSAMTFPPSSQTQIVSATPISCAFSSAAAIIASASCKVNRGIVIIA
jgi:hypothetical protein